MKRLFSFITCIIVTISLMTGCGNNPTANDKMTIVCSTFPQYDWTLEILGDKKDDFNVLLLLANGGDLHNYQPSTSDIVSISSCDLFIYNGGISDSWVSEAISQSRNKDLISINLLETMGDSSYTEELVQGMENEDHEHCDEDCNEDHSHEAHSSTSEKDEHIWLSLRNADVLCNAITDALCKLSPENEDYFRNNYQSYSSALKELDRQATDIVNASSCKTLLFGDRFPFRYFVEDYDIEYYAAFPGCSAETEASFSTIEFLASKADELKLPAICVTESSDKAIAQTIIDSTNTMNQNIVAFNSLQSITKSDISSGTTYLSSMKDNIEALKAALQ